MFELAPKQVDRARFRQTVEDLDFAISQMKNARGALSNLPAPIDDMLISSKQRIDEQIDKLGRARSVLMRMGERFNDRQNQRAVRVAKVLRAAYERYTRKRISCSETLGTVTSEFGQALEEVFGIIGMSANAFNFGKAARSCPADDPELVEIKETLRVNTDEQGDCEVFFCEITRSYIDLSEWHHVNTNADAQSLEIPEVSQCKYLKTNVFTTMTTRSLISLLRARNVPSGGTARLVLLGSSSGVE